MKKLWKVIVYMAEISQNTKFQIFWSIFVENTAIFRFLAKSHRKNAKRQCELVIIGMN